MKVNNLLLLIKASHVITGSLFYVFLEIIQACTYKADLPDPVTYNKITISYIYSLPSITSTLGGSLILPLL